MEIKLGTRRSKLALWQTEHVVTLLTQAWTNLQCETVPFVTKGDKTLDKPLAQIGGKGLFTAELEHALLSGTIDLAVHSLKDLPTDNPSGLTVGAIPARADARDVLISPSGQTLAQLPAGAVIGTSSLRRTAQIKNMRPDLEVQPIRGNIDTRIKKVEAGQYAAIVLAAAGVMRLGLDAHITEWFSFETMLPAPGQGALGIQCRADDAATLACLAAIDHAQTRACVTAERAFLAGLSGGCSTPIAAYATQDSDQLELTGLVASLTGQPPINVEANGHDASALGQQAAEQAMQLGAGMLLDAAA